MLSLNSQVQVFAERLINVSTNSRVMRPEGKEAAASLFNSFVSVCRHCEPFPGYDARPWFDLNLQLFQMSLDPGLEFIGFERLELKKRCRPSASLPASFACPDRQR